MSKFNTKAPGTKTTNLAGGEAFSQSAKLELVSILLTSFGGDQYYRTEDETNQKLATLIDKCDPMFASKAIVYARTKFGMRTITHVAASMLAYKLTGTPGASAFFDRVIHRPDDMMEILSYHKLAGRKVTCAMKRGLAKAFDRFNAYHLGKYRGEGKAFKLVDVVNIVHPIPVENNKEALKALVDGTLRSEDTWEVELSKAGQMGKDDKEKAVLKEQAWGRLISERKLGYFALLRNLRNLITQAPAHMGAALSMLTDEKLIKSSLVLPFRFDVAYDEIEKADTSKLGRATMGAISIALDISCSNVPKLEGDTLLVLDTSGSMTSAQGKDKKIPAKIGAGFCAVLAKAMNADIMTFDSNARYISYSPENSTISIARSIKFPGCATNFPAIFTTARQKYDRIIILSDMQGWVGGGAPTREFQAYKHRFNADPYIYSFDLQGYGSMQFPERNVFALAGFSDKIFDTMKYMESDKATLFDEIDKVQL